MRAVDAFCGAGGASCGLRDAGFDVLALEKWADAADTHDANHERPVLRVDLSTFDWSELHAFVGDEPFLFWASPPCQPFSSAGDQQGEDDARDGIPWWLTGLRVLQPPVAIMENVPGLTFEKHLDYLNRVLSDVRRLGYDFDWRVLDCADYGVPQNRERFVLIARRDGGRIVWPAPTHTAGESLFLQPWVCAAEAVPRLAELDMEWQRGSGGPVAMPFGHPRAALDEPAFTVTTGSNRRIVLNTHRDQRPDGTTQTRDPYSAPAPAPAPALTAKSGGQWTLDRPSTTVACDPRVTAPGRHDPGVSGSQMAGALRLEPHELAALQAFPAEYVWRGGKTSRCTQIGNAVPPPLARALASANRPLEVA